MPTKTETRGARIAGLATAVHRGPGRVKHLLISHAQSTPQQVVLYDSLTCSGTILAALHIHPYASPRLVSFPVELPFSIGLSINAGNCEVNLWSAAAE